jgi:hypothetical protein
MAFTRLYPTLCHSFLNEKIQAKSFPRERHEIFFKLKYLQEEDQDSRPALSEFLERLCLVLYDSLRPLIIQASSPALIIDFLSLLLSEELQVEFFFATPCKLSDFPREFI